MMGKASCTALGVLLICVPWRETQAQIQPATSSHTEHYSPWKESGQDQFDWIQMTSGEWLKGELKGLREGTLSFDSDEFDLQELDWDDVQLVFSGKPHIYVLDGQAQLRGPGLLMNGVLTIKTKRGEVSYERARLLSIVRTGSREIEHWRFKLSIGATARRGNTQSLDYTAYSRLRREDALTRFTAEYDGAFGLVSEERNTNKHRGHLEWLAYLSRRFYAAPLLGELSHDEFQNIDFRWIAAAGAGIHVVDTSPLVVDFQLGAGYAQTYFISTLPGQPSPIGGFLTIPTLTLEWDITADLEFEMSWYSALFMPQFKNTFHHGTARFSVDVTDVIDMDLSAIFDRMEDPTPNGDGTVPMRDDLAITAGIGIDLE